MENGTRTHPMNPEVFVGRCLFLQNHGFNVTVNVVAWPEQTYLRRPEVSNLPSLPSSSLPERPEEKNGGSLEF